MTSFRQRTRHIITTGIAASMLMLAACTTDEGEGFVEDWSVAGSLRQLPPGDGTVKVVMADVEAAEEAAGIETPGDLSDQEALMDWASALTATGQAEAPVFVPFPELLDVSRLMMAEEFDAELGWSIIDVDSFAENSIVPKSFTVVGGDFDEESLNPDLEDVGDDIVSAGSGEDFEVTGNRTAARPIGAPLRLAQRDGMIASSPSTPAMRSWLQGDASMADDEQLLALAEALDEQDVVSAMLLDGASAEDMEIPPQFLEQIDDMLPPEFAYLGVGWGVEEGQSRVTLAYAFDDEGSAEEAVPVLESQWTEGISLIDAAPLSGFGSVVEAEAAGSVAVIELEITDRAPGVIFQMIQRRDLPLLHR